MAVAIVTDSASDLPAELASRHEIEVVPLEVHLGDNVLPPSASGEEFWRLARESDALATTAAPSPGDFASAFSRASARGASGVVCLTISSALSATSQAATAGAREVAGEIAVEIVDSRQATMGEGLLALLAAELAADGGDAAQVAGALRDAIASVETLGTLESLDALKRGGRIGSAQALIGSLLSIKPVIELRDGVVEAESRQRTRGRSLRYLADKVAAAAPLDALAVVHADASDVGDFLTLVAEHFPADRTVVTHIGPVIGAHTGLGTIGVCFRRSSAGAGRNLSL